VTDPAPPHKRQRPGPGDPLGRLIHDHVPELIAHCRREITRRPHLENLVRQFRVKESDEWLREAVSLLHLCTGPPGPAAEWHDEVGELYVSKGLSIAHANEVLGLLRDGLLEMAWSARAGEELDDEQLTDTIRAVIAAFDHALAAQASAYVRESNRQLSEVNRALEFRQNVFERDLALAELVQRQFIPKSFQTKRLQAEVRYVPTAGIGGDHAGIFPVSPEQAYVTICDVTGHGIASALVAEVVSSRLRPLLSQRGDTTFQYSADPIAIVQELNRLFYDDFQPLGMLLTFFIALIDTREETITYAGAGHPPPILQCCGAKNCIELRSQNIILGAAEDCVIGEGQDVVPMHPGDRIIFYTDGIIEANDGRGEMWGLTGLRETVEQHYATSQRELADDILSTVQRISGKNPPDDMTLILVDLLEDDAGAK